MPRGKKPPPIKPPGKNAHLAVFSARVEQQTPEWLDWFIERERVLIERFHERDEDGKFVASASEQALLHRALTVSEANMMRFAVVREQIAKERGVSHFMEREGGTQNHLTLNFAASMTPEQRAYAERLFLSSLSGKEVEAPAPLVLPAQAEQVRESA